MTRTGSSRYCIALAVALLVTSGPAPLRAEDAAPDAPSLADLMSLTQIRQYKLWYAERAKNWELARYEYKQFQTTLARMGRSYPASGLSSLPAGVKEDVSRALEDLSSAIDEKSQKRFEAAFHQLTNACNACHQSAGVGFIKVQTPIRSPYGNQNFWPSTK